MRSSMPTPRGAFASHLARGAAMRLRAALIVLCGSLGLGSPAHAAPPGKPLSLRDIIGRWTSVDDPDCSKRSLSVMTVTPRRFIAEASQEAECDVAKWRLAEDGPGEKGFSSLVTCNSEGDRVVDAIHLAPLPGNRLQMRSRRWEGIYRRCPR
jgi:hypothetical protein